MFTKLFHLYALFKRPMTLGVRAIIEDRQGRILLVRHTYVSGWYLPGGGVENGQTFEDALAVELREEVKIGHIGEVELFGIYLNRHISKRDHVALYCCRNWSDMSEFKPDREIAEIGFFERDSFPEGTTKGTLARIAEVYDNQPRSKFW